MKLHVALDAIEQKAQAVELSTNAVDDAGVVEKLVGPLSAVINSFTGDGAYDKAKVRRCLHSKACEQGEALLECIPPRRGAVLDMQQRVYMQQRDEDIKAIKQMGRKQWKVLSNYHQRSKAETFMFRYKTILGASLQARKLEQQQTEVNIGCKILNLAKPQSKKVA